MTDGYWKLKVDKPGANIKLDIASIYSGNFDELDLAKGEVHGYPITSISSTSAFLNRTRLRTLTLPPTLTSLSDKAFMGCYNLSTILPKAIPDTVTHLGYSAFRSCAITGHVEWLGASSFRTDGSGNGMQFYSCKKITSFVLGRGLTTLPTYFLYECSKLTSCTLLGPVTSFDQFCLYNCSSLSEIEIPSTVTSLEKRCFYGCSSLQELVFPRSLTNIGEAALVYCSGIKTLTFKSKPSLFDNCFAYWPAYQARVFVGADDPAWQAVINDSNQVKKWADCTTERSSYTSLYSGRPIGILKTMINSKAQWLCGIARPTMFIVQ